MSAASGRLADDTIVALATAPGRGALAVVRLSGAGALEMGERVARPWPAEPRHATHTKIHDPAGEPLDDAVVVFYRAPSSFTGENAVEITCHGGVAVSASIIATLVAIGARPAEPGEFTRRAVLNGKLDLVQAEAVGDLVDASSTASHRIALAQLDGGLSRRITALRSAVIDLEALAAYDIDFPEEDDGPISPDRILASTRDTIAEIERLLATAPAGELVRSGAVVVIAGAPNVGKSSLFNALLGRRRAIVTDVPGTTRDALEAMTEADGWPVRLVDTAGLRDATDVVEKLGIEVSREYLADADVVLLCSDSDAESIAGAAAMSGLTSAPVIPVRTKGDLIGPSARSSASLVVSSETGEGLKELATAIADAIESRSGALQLDAPMITRERHRLGLEQANDELRQFHDAFANDSVPAVVAAVHLREATRCLEELIGTVDVENVLDRLFSSFCVGK